MVSLIPAGLIQNESGGNWRAQNDAPGAGGRRGHFGRLQFGHARLDDARRALGLEFTVDDFLSTPQLQEQVEQWHFGDIAENIRRAGLDRYIGQTIKGVPVTWDGLIAAAHLGGFPGAKRFIESGGKYDPSDGSNRLSDYLRKHQGGAPNTLPPGGVSTADPAGGGFQMPINMPPQAQQQMPPTTAGALPPQLLQLAQGQAGQLSPADMALAFAAAAGQQGMGPGGSPNVFLAGLGGIQQARQQARSSDMFAAQTQLGLMNMLGMKAPNPSELARATEELIFVDKLQGSQRVVRLMHNKATGALMDEFGRELTPEQASAMTAGLTLTDRAPTPMAGDGGGTGWETRNLPDGSLGRIGPNGEIKVIASAPKEEAQGTDYEITMPDGSVTYSRGLPEDLPPGARVSKIGTGGGKTPQAAGWAYMVDQLTPLMEALKNTPDAKRTLGTLGAWGSKLTAGLGIFDAILGTNAKDAAVRGFFGGLDPGQVRADVQRVVLPIAKTMVDPSGPLANQEQERAQLQVGIDTLSKGSTWKDPELAFNTLKETLRIMEGVLAAQQGQLPPRGAGTGGEMEMPPQEFELPPGWSVEVTP